MMHGQANIKDMQCTYNERRVRVTIVAVGKQRVTYSEYVSTVLATRHAMRMRRIVVLRDPLTTTFFHFTS
jgi:hypothetical protein